MKKIFLMLVVIAIFMTNCTSGKPSFTDKEDMKTVCLDGVKYYLFKESAGYSGYGFMSPKYSKNGRIVICD